MGLISGDNSSFSRLLFFSPRPVSHRSDAARSEAKGKRGGEKTPLLPVPFKRTGKRRKKEEKGRKGGMEKIYFSLHRKSGLLLPLPFPLHLSSLSLSFPSQVCNNKQSLSLSSLLRRRSLFKWVRTKARMILNRAAGGGPPPPLLLHTFRRRPPPNGTQTAKKIKGPPPPSSSRPTVHIIGTTDDSLSFLPF